jgi:hypothetical protein
LRWKSFYSDRSQISLRFCREDTPINREFEKRFLQAQLRQRVKTGCLSVIQPKLMDFRPSSSIVTGFGRPNNTDTGFRFHKINARELSIYFTPTGIVERNDSKVRELGLT